MHFRLTAISIATHTLSGNGQFIIVHRLHFISENPLLLACHQNEITDALGRLQLIPGSDKISGGPEITRNIFLFEAGEVIKNSLRRMLADEAHELGRVSSKRNGHHPM
jgi:hypothetical protein